MIVYGTRIVKKQLGHVAEFCPRCRGMTCFAVVQLDRASHVYFITLASEKITEVMECTACKTCLSTDVSKYANLAPSPQTDLEALARTTFPNYFEAHATRLAVEEQIRKNPKALSPATRVELIAEILEWAAPELDVLAKRRNNWTCLGCLGGFALSLGAGILTADPAYRIPGLDPLLGPFLVSLVLVVVLAVANHLSDKASRRKYQRRVMSPAIGKAIAILQPEAAEIRAALGRFKSGTLDVIMGIDVDEIAARARE